VNHAGARQQCQSYGGDLVSIHSQGEQDFVSSLIARNCKFVKFLIFFQGCFREANLS